MPNDEDISLPEMSELKQAPATESSAAATPAPAKPAEEKKQPEEPVKKAAPASDDKVKEIVNAAKQ